MKQCILAVIGVLLTVGGCVGQSKTPDVLKIEFKKIRDDIYLAYRPDTLRYWVEGNVVIIINDSDVVVVDASGTPTTAQSVIREIRRLTKKPVRFVINTHGHGDHTIGNQEYLKQFPGVDIIAHPKTLEYIAGAGYNYVDEIAKSTKSRQDTGEAEISRLKAESKPGVEKVTANLSDYYRHDIAIRQTEYRKTKRTPPTITVDKSLRLIRGSRIIDILHFGAGDTPGDLIVHLPRERIVCTGDMITQPVPFGYSRFPLEWRQTLMQVSALDFDTLIPGHGEVQNGKSYVNSVIGLLQSVQDQVKRGIDAGLDLEGVRKKVDVSEFQNAFAGDDPVNQYYFHEYFVIPNVERTFNVLKTNTAAK